MGTPLNNLVSEVNRDAHAKGNYVNIFCRRSKMPSKQVITVFLTEDVSNKEESREFTFQVNKSHQYFLRQVESQKETDLSSVDAFWKVVRSEYQVEEATWP